MHEEYVDEALFELYLEEVDNDTQKIERNSHCQEHLEGAIEEMRLKYAGLIASREILTPTEYTMLRWIIE